MISYNYKPCIHRIHIRDFESATLNTGSIYSHVRHMPLNYTIDSLYEIKANYIDLKIGHL